MTLMLTMKACHNNKMEWIQIKSMTTHPQPLGTHNPMKAPKRKLIAPSWCLIKAPPEMTQTKNRIYKTSLNRNQHKIEKMWRKMRYLKTSKIWIPISSNRQLRVKPVPGLGQGEFPFTRTNATARATPAMFKTWTLARASSTSRTTLPTKILTNKT